MKEDILEQLVEDYLHAKGYFTRHNIRFKPDPNHDDFVKNQDSNTSDVDVVGFNPLEKGARRVVVASCKSWQGGFDPAAKLKQISDNAMVGGREAWKSYRELLQPKWSDAFMAAIEKATGTRVFTYWTVVTNLKNEQHRASWEKNARFSASLNGNPIEIVTLKEILDFLWGRLSSDAAKQTPEASDIGRALQLMKASKWRPE